MNARKIIGLWLAALACGSELYGQMISGTVVDENNHPIVGASIFIASTTVGTLTDEKGFFSLRLPLQRAELVISFVGYKRVVKQITSIEQQLFFQLEPDAIVAEELTVRSDNREWRRNLERFTRIFIGTTHNAQHCKILNPEVLDFRTKSDDQVLQAVASKPLVIENRALGYRLLYQLNIFEEKHIDRSPKIVSRKGWSMFENLTPKDSVEVKTIEENRRRAYFGSPRHLFRSLALRKAAEGDFSEGFELHEVDAKDYQKGFLRRSRINADMLIEDGITPAEKVLRLPPCLEVVYTKSDYDLLFRKELFLATGSLKGSVWTNRGKHQISLLESYGGTITLDTLGNIISVGLQPMFHGYWSWTSGVADMLPLDFNPNVDFEVNRIQWRAGHDTLHSGLDSMRHFLMQGYDTLTSRDTTSAANDAIASLTKFIEAYPDSSQGYYLRGLIRKERKDYSRANVDFTKALLIEPSNADLHVQRGTVRLFLKSYDEAINDFSKSLLLDSLLKHQAEALVYRAIAYSRQSLDSLALVDIRRSIALYPRPMAHLQLALMFQKQQRYQDAEREFSDAIKLNSLLSDAYFHRGKLRLEMLGEKVSGYLDLARAKRLGSGQAEQYLNDIAQGSDTLRFYNTPEIVVEALPLDVEKMVVKMVETTKQQQLSLRIAQTNINVNPDAFRRIGQMRNEIGSRLEELARRTNDEKLLRKLQDFKSLLIKMSTSSAGIGPGSSEQAFQAGQRFLADMSGVLAEIQSFMEELQEYLVAFNGKSQEKK